MLKKVHKQITGGNSIPVVNIMVSFYPEDHYARWRGAQVSEFINKWIVEFKIYNSDDFPLTNIRFYKTTQGSGIYPFTTQLPTISVLGPHETKTFFPTIVIEDDRDSFIVSHSIKVEWNAIEYIYKTYVEKKHIIDTLNQQYKWEYYSRNTSYSYKDKSYTTPLEFETELQKDLK